MGSSIVGASFVAMVMVAMLVALIRRWQSPEVVVFLSLLVVWNAGILSNAEALSGFNNPGMLVIGALFVVVASIENSRLADKAASRILGLQTTFSAGFLRLMLVTLAMSAFVNNTPVVALLIPVAKDWARTRGFDPALLLMPLSFVSAFGGLLTTVGGGTNLVIQGLLYEAGKSNPEVGPLALFEPALVGAPLAVIGIGYLLFVVPRLLAPKDGGSGDGVRTLRDRSEELVTEVEVTGSFELVGQPFALLLAGLGLPIDTLVKVRRRSQHDGPSGKSLPLGRTGVDSCDTDSSRTHGAGNDDEESNRIGWVGRDASTASAGADSRTRGVGPFALRRRSPYFRLETGSSGDRSTTSSGVAAPCVEMAKIKTNGVGGKTGDDAASTAGGGAPEEKINNDNNSSGKDADKFEDIYGVSAHATIRSGDVLMLSCARDPMVRFQGSLVSQRRKGLKVMGVSTLTLPRHGTVFFELVISRRSRFLGRTASLDNAFFEEYYGCSVLAVRLNAGTESGDDGIVDAGSGGNRFGDDDDDDDESAVASGASPTYAALKGERKSGGSTTAVGGIDEAVLADTEDAATVADSPLLSAAPTPVPSSPVGGEPQAMGEGALPPVPAFGSRRRRRRQGEGFAAGDTVLVLAMEGFLEKASSAREFLCKKRRGRLPEPTGWFHFFPLIIFAAMLAWVLFVGVDMVR